MFEALNATFDGDYAVVEEELWLPFRLARRRARLRRAHRTPLGGCPWQSGVVSQHFLAACTRHSHNPSPCRRGRLVDSEGATARSSSDHHGNGRCVRAPAPTAGRPRKRHLHVPDVKARSGVFHEMRTSSCSAPKSTRGICLVKEDTFISSCARQRSKQKLAVISNNSSHSLNASLVDNRCRMLNPGLKFSEDTFIAMSKWK